MEPQADPGNGRSGQLWPVAVVVAAALIPYLLLPANPLLLDAQRTNLANQAVQSGPLLELFSADFWGSPLTAEFSNRSYRPLVSLTYALQVRMLGNGPAGFHIFDMVLHALAALLVLLLLRGLGLRSYWAVAAATLFAVHPLQTLSLIHI